MIDAGDIKDIIFRVNVKVKVLSAFIILIVIPYFIYNFSIVPLLDEQKRLTLDLSAQQNLLKTRKASIANIDQLEAKLKKTKSKLEKMEKKFLKEENLPTFFTELRQLAEKNKVEVANLKLAQEPKATQTYEGLPARLALTGDYLDVIMFISQIRKESALFSIDAMVMYGKNKPNELLTNEPLTNELLTNEPLTNELLTVELHLILYIIQEEEAKEKNAKI